MRKYWYRFLSAIQTEFQYRTNLFAWMLVGAIGPVVMVFVWLAILKQQPTVGGYNQGDFILYYLFRYIFFEPVAIALGKQLNPDQVVLWQGLFILILFVLYKILWRAGIKKYEGNGG